MPIAVADPRALLELWERALPLNDAAREALFASVPSDAPPTFGTLGTQRRRLLQRLQQQVGEVIALRCRCPACGEQITFDIVLPTLLEALPASDPPGEHRLEHGAWQVRFRLPGPDDLLSLGDEADEHRFAAALMQRCLIEVRHDGRPAAELPAPLCERVSARMEALDPAASLAFAVTCTGCAHRWSAPFDAARALLVHAAGRSRGAAARHRHAGAALRLERGAGARAAAHASPGLSATGAAGLTAMDFLRRLHPGQADSAAAARLDRAPRSASRMRGTQERGGCSAGHARHSARAQRCGRGVRVVGACGRSADEPGTAGCRHRDDARGCGAVVARRGDCRRKDSGRVAAINRSDDGRDGRWQHIGPDQP